MLKHYYSVAKREISLLTKIDGHLNLVRYFAHDYVEGDDFIYLILEKCHGTLTWLMAKRRQHQRQQQHQQQQQLTVETQQQEHTYLREALLELCSGLEHMHELRIVHRDIKPQNILLVPRHNEVVKSGKSGKTGEREEEMPGEEMPRELSWSHWRLKISDMGLGKAMTRSSSSSASASSVVGGGGGGGGGDGDGRESFNLSSQVYWKQKRTELGTSRGGVAPAEREDSYAVVGTEGQCCRRCCCVLFIFV